MNKILLIIALAISSLTAIAQQDNWQIINTKFNDVSGVLHAPAKDTVFIHRIDGSLLRSFNGGITWDSVFIRHDSTYFTDMGSHFVNGKVGFTWGIWSCMYTGFVNSEIPMLLKTTNSGKTWQPAMVGFGSNKVVVAQMHFWDANNGFLIGAVIEQHPVGTNYSHTHANEIYMTADGGNTWILNNSMPIDEIKNTPKMISFCDNYNGILMGKELNLNYSKSTDGGFTWANTNLHKFGYNATGVCVLSPQKGFVLANDSLYSSNDNLQTFTASKLPFSNYNNTIMANNASHYNDGANIYYLTFNDNIYKSTIDLNTFTISKKSNNTPNYSIAGYNGDVYIYAVNGMVYKKTVTVNSVNAIKGIKKTVTLYPNPSTENTVNYTTTYKVKSYTITNNEGKELMRKNVDGTQTINSTGLGVGIYLITFYDGNNKFVASSKLIKN
jgi:photosystem II stability/assembly factor-like uncharacterized protein